MTITVSTCAIAATLIFFFANYIGYIFVRDSVTADYVGNVIVWYSLFIFFDWAKTMFNSLIRGFDKNSSMDIICSLILLFIFLPLGMLMTFSFEMGYKGFWYGNYISMVILTAICGMNFFYIGFDEKKQKSENKPKKEEQIDDYDDDD